MQLTHRELKSLRALRQKKIRLAQQRFLIEGLRLVREALSSAADVEQVLVTDKFAACPAWPELLTNSRDITAISITETQAEQLGDTRHPQGIFAVLPVPAVHYQPQPPVALPALILDGISDPGNLGTLLRTAGWFGVRTVLVSATSADVYNPKVVRGGMGAHFQLPAIWQGESLKIARTLEAEEVLLLGATMDGQDLSRLSPINDRWALVIGSEAHGLSELWNERLDIALTIPGSGSGESLNAAVAAGIVLHFLQQHSNIKPS